VQLGIDGVFIVLKKKTDAGGGKLAQVRLIGPVHPREVGVDP